MMYVCIDVSMNVRTYVCTHGMAWHGMAWHGMACYGRPTLYLVPTLNLPYSNPQLQNWILPTLNPPSASPTPTLHQPCYLLPTLNQLPANPRPVSCQPKAYFYQPHSLSTHNHFLPNPRPTSCQPQATSYEPEAYLEVQSSYNQAITAVIYHL